MEILLALESQKIVNERRENIPSLTCAFLAHLLAAAFEVLAFELPVFGIRLGEMVGVDKRIATPETAKLLFSAWDANRIVSDPPAWAHI
jgi:hypothetical protein